MRKQTSKEILDKCPEVIHPSSLSIDNRGRPRTGGGSRKVAWYYEKDKINAAALYAIHTNFPKVSEMTNIPVETLRSWRGEEWWHEVVSRVKIEKDDEHDKKFTDIMDKSLEAINERLDGGDTLINTKTGERFRKPMGGKEIGVLLSIVADKRDLIRRKAKTNVEAQSTKDLLQQIASTVRDFVKKQPKVIEGEVLDVTVQSEEAPQVQADVLT